MGNITEMKISSALIATVAADWAQPKYYEFINMDASKMRNHGMSNWGHPLTGNTRKWSDCPTLPTPEGALGLRCNAGTCAVLCPGGSRAVGRRRTRCRYTEKLGWYWKEQLGSCQTCDVETPESNDPLMTTACKVNVNTGRKFCKMNCPADHLAADQKTSCVKARTDAAGTIVNESQTTRTTHAHHEPCPRLAAKTTATTMVTTVEMAPRLATEAMTTLPPPLRQLQRQQLLQLQLQRPQQLPQQLLRSQLQRQQLLQPRLQRLQLLRPQLPRLQLLRLQQLLPLQCARLAQTLVPVLTRSTRPVVDTEHQPPTLMPHSPPVLKPGLISSLVMALIQIHQTRQHGRPRQTMVRTASSSG